MAAKTFLVGLTIIVKHLCFYIVKYESQIRAHISSSGLSDGNKGIIYAFLATTVDVCQLLRGITGY